MQEYTLNEKELEGCTNVQDCYALLQDHERAFFDSADWELGKQGVEKPKGPLEALRPKLQPTQQQTRYRKSPYAPADGEDGGSAPSEDATANE
nr:uncharacterized protein LOC118036116 [Populus alba]